MPTPIAAHQEAGRRLARADLLDLLDRSRDYALTLLLAPPGFGKSTLLQQWRNQHHCRHMVLMALDPRDADPVHFFARLTDTLRAVVPDFDTASYTPLSAAIHTPAHTVAEALLQALEAVNNELFIILDDFHRASHPLVQEVISILLENLPFHIHVVLASRSHPDFSLSRLKLADRLLLIDSHDLRLTAQQVHELAKGMGLPVPDEDHIQQLLQQTEGWMAGIKMALLACSRAGLHAIDAFNGTQPELVDYFAHVVLRELPEDQRNFLMHTAMMEHFDAALCDAVMHRNDSARVIDRLLAQSLFLQPIDHLPGWYRYHPLFQSFLRSQMQIDHPDQLPVLHATIAQAWLLRGDNEIALSHAEKSEQPDFFMSTLRTACDYWSHKGDGSSIIRWLSPMADEVILADRDLSIALISALILSRRFNQARYYLDASANITHDNPLDDSTRAFLELMLQVFQHDTDFRLNADQAMLISSSQHHDIRAFSLAMLAYHHLLHGEFSDALVYADQSKTVLEQLGYDYLSSYADLILILCDRNTGRLLHASQNAELNFRKQQHCAYTQPWINAATAAAVVRYEQNRTQEALSLLEKLVPVVNSSCATEIIVYTYLILARLLRCRHEKPRASRLLAQLSRILQMGNYDRFVSQVVHEELLHAWASNDIDAMDRVADTHQLEARLNNGTWRRSRDYDEAWERYGMATALWLTAHQRFEEAEHTLEVILGALKKSGAHSRAVVTEANLVLIRHQMGDDNVALHRLKRLIDQYSIICINRTVYDEAPGLNRFLKRCHDVGNLPLPSIYADMFRNLLEDTSVQTDTPKTDAALLTAKEQEVLTLLCNGLSNNEISNRIGVALSTTKWHLKNIFAKMGVANRTAAILQASQNGNTLRTQLWVAATTASVTLTELPIPALL